MKSKIADANEKIEEKVTSGFVKIQDGVVNGYKKIENGVVGGFAKIEDSFVARYLVKGGESVEDAKKRLKGENHENR